MAPIVGYVAMFEQSFVSLKVCTWCQHVIDKIEEVVPDINEDVAKRIVDELNDKCNSDIVQDIGLGDLCHEAVSIAGRVAAEAAENGKWDHSLCSTIQLC